jgi:hypothetical protein
VPGFADTLVFYRRVTLGENFQIDGFWFPNLIKVRIGNDEVRYDFYFAPDHGLLAYIYWQNRTIPPDAWVTYDKEGEYYYKRFDGDDPLVFPTSR